MENFLNVDIFIACKHTKLLIHILQKHLTNTNINNNIEVTCTSEAVHVINHMDHV